VVLTSYLFRIFAVVKFNKNSIRKGRKMGFQKGKSGNPLGKPVGAKNKVTGNVRLFIADLINEQRTQILKDLKDTTPEKRLDFFAKLLPFVAPKLSAIAWSDNSNTQDSITLMEEVARTYTGMDEEGETEEDNEEE
jgi:hypothetical protein